MRIRQCLAMALGRLGAAPASARPASSYRPRFDPAPAGLPFSSAVSIGPVLIMSGQIGLRPDGQLATGFEAQARQTMDNIIATAKLSGATANDIVKCTVMLSDMANWPTFNSIYLSYFGPHHLPARSAFGATGLAMGAELEVECWAYRAER